MILTKRTIWSCLAAAGLCLAQVSAQDLTDMTLDYTNVTSTNVNQTVNEINNNEKEVEFGDYDNDGDVDVIMAVALGDFGQRRNKLYRNDNGVLNEVTSSVIPGFSLTDTTRSAFFRDYNGDGDLDIIVINDSNSGTATNDAPGKTKLFIQENGVFVNMSQNLAGQTGAACNGVSADFDQNGLPDLMMCNYPNISQDSLTLNGINGNSPGVFTLVTNTHYPQESRYGVHSEGADMNGDGLIDILVTNQTNSQQFIYYNNLNGAGTGPGDFRYTGSAQLIPESQGSVLENGMFPADFDGDGDQDIFFANHGQFGNMSDAILVNTGNAANGFANFSVQAFSDVSTETHKVSRTDLDGDGKIDLVVMDNVSRPRIYRNISTLDEIAFVEWTEAIFTAQQDGWHANSADITGNGRNDLLVGATNDDFLFENNSSSVVQFGDINGIVPSFHDSDPVAVAGNVEGGGAETLLMVIPGGVSGVPAGANLSIVARSEADIDIVLKVSGNTVASSARTDVGHEGLQYTTATNASLVLEITNNSTSDILLGDLNGDGVFNLLDVSFFVDLLTNGGFDPAGDFNNDGLVNLLDVGGFVDGLSGGGGGSGGASSAPFVVEFLSN